MEKTIIYTQNAPAPIGPYSQAVRAGDLLFLSGQIALIPGTEQLNNETIEAETIQIMKNLASVLDQSGADFSNIVKTTIFLSDMSHFAKVNEIYATYFSSNYPARETVAVKGLPKNVNVEISMIAVL